MSNNRGLGRGIDALFAGNIEDVLSEEDKSRVRIISITDLVADPDQPRKKFDEVELAGLADSITRHGVLQPLVAVEQDGKYQIVAGERRWRAAKSAGLEKLPVIVRTLKELEKLEISLIENVQRVDLSPFEQALSIYRLKNEFNVEASDIANRLGKAQTTISNIVRLLNLPKEAIKALQNSQINEGHARAILSLDGLVEKQDELLQNILSQKWTVRQAEKFAQDNKVKPSHSVKNLVDTGLSKRLNTQVTIQPKKRGGQIIISYKNEDELASLKKQLLN
ncbi:MAG: ParB/RepB/Spo0J family partition protein [bacterium]|nr:ParB/RepB/Spo0J family partition protein [bacterium]